MAEKKSVPEVTEICTPGTKEKKRRKEQKEGDMMVMQGRRNGDMNVTYVQPGDGVVFATTKSGEGWQRITFTLLVVFTFLCGVLVGGLLGAGTCSELDSSGWGQYNPVQAAVSMWRTSQNPWVQLLSPGTAHASAEGALSFVGIGCLGLRIFLECQALDASASSISSYETCGSELS